MIGRRWGATSLVLVGALVVAACAQERGPAGASSSGASGAAQAGGNFRFGHSGDVRVLDPWNVTDGGSLLVTRQIYESLVDHEPTGFKIVPKLATSWETSADGRTWSLTLREGVRFHDGSDLDAEAVVFNFERGRNTKHPQRGKPAGDGFAAFREMWGGFDADSLITRVEATGPRTVTFTLRSGFGPFLATLAMPTFAIVSPRSVTEDPDGWMTVGSKGLAGTGPFQLEPGGWQGDAQIALERNPGYWQRDDGGAALPYVDRVTFRALRDSAARIAELKAGGVDAIGELPPQDMATIKADPNLGIIARPSFNVAYLGVNHTVRPLDDVNARRAVAHAINTGAIAQALYAGEARPASQFLLPGMLGYDDSVTEFYRYDEAAARKALADAGLPSGFEIDLWYMPVPRPYYPDPKRIAEAFAADLAKVGIKATLRTEDWTSYRKDARDNRFGLWLLGWTGESADPDSFLGASFKPRIVEGKDAPIEGGAWSNPQAWALLRQARTETSDSKRGELYKQVSKILRQEVARIPTFYANLPLAATKKVQGFVPHPTGGEAFTRVSLAR